MRDSSRPPPAGCRVLFPHARGGVQQQALHAPVRRKQQHPRRVAVEPPARGEVGTAQVLRHEVVHRRVSRVALADVAGRLVHEAEAVLARGHGRTVARDRFHARHDLVPRLGDHGSVHADLAPSDALLRLLERHAVLAGSGGPGTQRVVEANHIFMRVLSTVGAPGLGLFGLETAGAGFSFFLSFV